MSKTALTNSELLLISGCRCLDDVDDEVRDRAAMYLKVYEEPPLVQPYIKEGASCSKLRWATVLTVAS